MGAFIDLTGKRFGRLTVIKISGDLHNRKAWECQCDCTVIKIVTSNDLKRGVVQSCGCYRRETTALKSKKAGIERGKQLKKHGLHGIRLYAIWKSMRNRCNNPKSKDYIDYGNRGIKICKEWDDFKIFHTWAMDNKYDIDAPFGTCTIDRICVDSGYEPSNCRFVDSKVQANNRRPRRKRSDQYGIN